MARVRKEKAGSAPGGLVWEKDGAVLDVPDDLAAELIRIPTGGFTTVPEDAPLDVHPPVGADPPTAVPGPHVFPAGRTAQDGPIGVPVGLPAHTQPVPAGSANPGGEPPTPDYPHGAVVDTTEDAPKDDEDNENEDEGTDGEDDVKPPPAKAARQRQRRRVTE